MDERWVNGSVTVTFVLDLPVQASKAEKQEAVVDLMEWISERLEPRASDFVMSGHWEDVDEEVLSTADPADELAEAVEQIADLTIPTRNPDGEDQAAETMQLIAQEALDHYRSTKGGTR